MRVATITNTLLAISGFAAATLALAAPTVRAAACSATFTTRDTLFAGELTYEGCDVTVSGATLVVIGPHTFASLVVDAGGSVTSANLDSLTLTITGDAFVEAGSRISVDGRGYALGTGAGAGSPGTPAAGGSYGGRGANAGTTVSGPTYGSWTGPSALGSGGGASGVSTGRGGGALRLSVGGALHVDGAVRARGDTAGTVTPNYSPGGGSGGSILVGAGSLGGTGTFDASGGRGWNGGGAGGGGRIAIEYGSSTFAGSLVACGAPSSVAGRAGAAGTIWMRDRDLPDGELRIENCGTVALARTDLPDAAVVVSGVLRVRDAATVGVAAGSPLHLTVTGDLEVEAGGGISVDGLGYALGAGPGAGRPGTPAGGGSHGGRGGTVGAVESGPTYGSLTNTFVLGSGGGVSGVSNGRGGGALRLDVAGVLRVDGVVSARGDTASTLTPNYSPGGGSGGSILVGAGSLEGTGTFDASGGRGWNGGGAGGGGRIAIEYGSSTFEGSLLACGAPSSVAERAGAAGTIWTRDRDLPQGVLRVANCDRWTLAHTELPDTGTTIQGMLHVREAGIVSVAKGTPLHVTVQGDLVVEVGAALSVDGCGYALGMGPGAGGSGSPAAGGSHGGRGASNGAVMSGPTYGSAAFPAEFGSGGGSSGVSISNGGGVLQLDVAGEIRVDGRVSARGDSARTLTPAYSPGGGAGGSVRVSAEVISGTGVIDASGGPGLNGGGGGGGGRVTIESLCWDGFSLSQIVVAGGPGGTTPSEPGSIYPEFEVGIAAGPIATSGALRLLGYPRSLAEGELESLDTLFVLKERGGLRLAAGDSVQLEIMESGPVASASSLSPAVLPPGTWLNSHVIHLDPPASGLASARGSVTFDTNVLGLIVTDDGLEASDAVLHAPGVDYPYGLAGRGAELTGLAGGDSIEISADRRTVTFVASAQSSLDQIRVITAVPLATCGPVADAAPGSDAPDPDVVTLLAPFPNPARGLVGMRFALARAARVQLDIFDLAGRRVARLADGPRSAGWHTAEWRPGTSQAARAGVYFARLQAGSIVRATRIVICE